MISFADCDRNPKCPARTKYAALRLRGNHTLAEDMRLHKEQLGDTAPIISWLTSATYQMSDTGAQEKSTLGADAGSNSDADTPT